MPFSEGQGVDHPLQFYAATKRANELMAHAYAHLFRLPCTGLRFFTVYGPWGRPDMAPMIFASAIAAGRPIKLFNHGHHSRDFTYVDDIADGVIRASDQIAAPDPAWDPAHPDPGTSDAPFRLYNIGNGAPGGASRLHRRARARARPPGDPRAAAAAARRRARHLRRHRPADPRHRLAAAGPGRRGGAPLRRLVPRLPGGRGAGARLGLAPPGRNARSTARPQPGRGGPRCNRCLSPRPGGRCCWCSACTAAAPRPPPACWRSSGRAWRGPRCRADAFNTKGYWEPLPIVELHNRLLAEAGSAWDDWGRLDPERIDPGAAEALAGLYAAEFGDAALAVLKDPRICRFVPLWRAVLERLGVAPKVVIALRHPLEVAGSLAGRDGMALDEALLLWLRHCLEAEAATRGLPRSFLRYADLMADWRACVDRLAQDLELDWPTPPEAAAEGIADFLSRDMRHHAVAEAEGPLAPWVDESRAALDDLARADAAAPRARLDAVRAALDAADGLMGTALRRQRHAARRRRRPPRPGPPSSGRPSRPAGPKPPPRCAAAAAQADAARRRAGETAAAQGALLRARGALAELGARNARLRAELADREAELLALLGSRSWKLTAPLRNLAGRLRRGWKPPARPEPEQET